MRLFRKVAIIGVGLIGGSIALDIKKRGLAQEVVGVSRHKKSISIAKKLHAIDRGSQEISIARNADLVVLALPVAAIMDLAPRIARVIKRDCLVTDVGSTKREVVSRLEKIFPLYVGSHPLAGSEKRGVVHSRSGIFKDTVCMITPTKNTSSIAVKRIKRLWSSLGMRIVSISAGKHDEILSFISHLPHAVSFSLINAVPRRYLGLSSTGLKDTTRIAASDPRLWCDIFLTNQKRLCIAIDSFQRGLSRLKSAIRSKDKKTLFKILKTAQERQRILE